MSDKGIDRQTTVQVSQTNTRQNLTNTNTGLAYKEPKRLQMARLAEAASFGANLELRTMRVHVSN